MPDPPPAQALIDSGMNAVIVRTGRIEADAPSGGRVEVSAQGALPAGATISPTQARSRSAAHNLRLCGRVWEALSEQLEWSQLCNALSA